MELESADSGVEIKERNALQSRRAVKHYLQEITKQLIAPLLDDAVHKQSQ